MLKKEGSPTVCNTWVGPENMRSEITQSQEDQYQIISSYKKHQDNQMQMRVQRKMAEEEDAELTSFHGPTKITATCVQLTLEKKKKKPNWQKRTSTVNHREATCKRVRGAEIRLGTTPMVRLTTDRRESTS